MKLSRLISMLLVIEGRRQVTAKVLAEMFEVSVRTVYRDVALLCEAGLPIYATTGPTGGFSLIEGYKINAKTLDRDEMKRLIFSLYGQKILVGQQDTDTLLLKLGRTLPKDEQNRLTRLMEATKFDPKGWWGDETVTSQPKEAGKRELSMGVIGEHLTQIQLAIYEGEKLIMDYEGQNSMTKDRKICPYGLVNKQNSWYLVGYCEQRAACRTFKVERMKHLRHTQENFEVPEDFDMDLYWERSTHAFVSRTSITNPPATQEEAAKATPKRFYSVTLLSERALEPFIGGFFIGEQTLGPEGFFYDVDLISERTALQMLLPLIPFVKVLSPAVLKNKVIEHLKMGLEKNPSL